MSQFLPSAHAIRDEDELLRALETSPQGLSREEAALRLKKVGANALPRPEPTSSAVLILRQFYSPLIYILLLAALVSLLLGEMSDAIFIFAVLAINAVIGAIQEYSAERSAEALRSLVTAYAHVTRVGEAFEIDAQQLVPGDLVWLENGFKVPADLRLLWAQGLEIDESLLTGESAPVVKDSHAILDVVAPLGDRKNMAFAGTLVTYGRGQGIVVATGLKTEIGRLAALVLSEETTKPPPKPPSSLWDHCRSDGPHRSNVYPLAAGCPGDQSSEPHPMAPAARAGGSCPGSNGGL
jgi:P-type Ca2+ transporter type 2C